SATLIAFLVRESDTDKFHEEHDRIVQVFSDDPFEKGSRIWYTTNRFSEYLKSNYPEVENICQISSVADVSVETMNAFHNLNVVAFDTSFFSMFDFRLTHGYKGSCLFPGRIILSERKALMLFGRTDVIDEMLTIQTRDSTLQLVVSGV